MRAKPSRPKRTGVVQQSNASRTPLNLPKTPRKLARQPPLKGTRRETLQDIARRVPVEVLLPYFNFSLRTAADAMCISVTSLKRLCRRHGVKRWPHRQLSGLNRTVSHLEERQATSSDPDIARQLARLYCRRDEVIDLAFTSDDNSSEPESASPSRIPDAEETRGASVDSETMLLPPPPVEAYYPARAGAPGGQGAARAPHSRLLWGNPEAMAPAGGRPGASQQWQRQQEMQLQHQEYNHHRNRGGGGDGASRGFGGEKAGARDPGRMEDRRPREWGDSSRWVDGGSSSGSGSGSGRGFEAVRGEPGFFRESSASVRCPVEPSRPPPCYARAIAPPPPLPQPSSSSSGGVESPTTGEPLQMQPSSRGPVGGRAAGTTSRVVDSMHHPWPSPTHFAPLPSPEHLTGGSVETRTVPRHGAAFDPPSRRRPPPPSEAEAGGGGGMASTREMEWKTNPAARVPLQAGGGGGVASTREMEWTTNPAAREPPQVGTNVAGSSSGDSAYGRSASRGGYGDGDGRAAAAAAAAGGGGEEGESRRHSSGNGPLPSIARLVEAGALLSGLGDGEWRHSHRHQAPLRFLHERAGAV